MWLRLSVDVIPSLEGARGAARPTGLSAESSHREKNTSRPVNKRVDNST